MTSLPFLLRRFSTLDALDQPRRQALERDGIVTLADLELAIAEERPVAADPSLREMAHTIAREVRPLNLGRAWEIVDGFLAVLAVFCREIQEPRASGALRRAEPLVSGLVVVGWAVDPARAIDAVAALPLVSEVLYRTTRRLVLLAEGQEIDVRISTADEYGSLLFATTGPAAHVAAVYARRGRHLSASEADAYKHAGLAFLPAETRDAPDALQRAAGYTVPPLIGREHIRGDLHMHTTYSDGRDSLRHMVAACLPLGYEYIAITDHSEHAGAAHTLRIDEMARQADDIARLRAEFPHMAILHGLEVDILPDGSLDCPDAVLARLDIVLASLHDSAGHTARRLTERCLAAIRHPLVSVISHPANQLVGRRPGYEMDYPAIYDAAAQTGTALEIDGAPSHLDLSGERAREAVEAGVTVVIDSDCHRAGALDRQMRMGVGTARRGWVEPHQVLNTRPVREVQAFITRKRGG